MRQHLCARKKLFEKKGPHPEDSLADAFEKRRSSVQVVA
jgi:hypothetical protein